MSDSPTYTFLPWVRLGLSTGVTQADHDESVRLRASIPIELGVSSTRLDGATQAATLRRDVQLYGPGDVVGFDAGVVVKTEPRNWITAFEPNYLPYVEFYDEDFPWRYTPAAPAGERLRPWITLVVLAEEEFREVADAARRPLPAFQLLEGLNAADLFPNAAELWAWAHVHVNRELRGASAATDLEATLRDDPDQAFARLLSPRRLHPNRAYHAFVVPTFESGRLAGLGLEVPADLPATRSAWAGNARVHPYYYRWTFRTGAAGDFEHLVRLLRPRPPDKQVGVRDLDVTRPGPPLPPITTPDLRGVLRLGGALRVPTSALAETDREEVSRYDEWDEPRPHDFQRALAAHVNLADDYTARPPGEVNRDHDPDPVVTMPLYGRWHGLTSRLAPGGRDWLHELNLDPRWRAAAALGTKVVQQLQEDFMKSSWEQVGHIVEANARIRAGQLAREAGLAIEARHLSQLTTDARLLITAPVHRRVLVGGLTARHRVEASAVPVSALAPQLRRIARPRGRLVRRLPFTPESGVGRLVERLNANAVAVAPPPAPPAGAILLSHVSAAVSPQGAPSAVRAALERAPWLVNVLLMLAVILVLIGLASLAGLVSLPTTVTLAALGGAAVAAAGWGVARDWSRRIEAARTLTPEAQTPASVDAIPEPPGRPDVQRFKAALREAYVMAAQGAPPPPRPPLALSALDREISAALDPARTVARRVGASLTIPARLAAEQVQSFAPVMMYPEIDTPMYRPLAELGAELFLPNINLIPQNSLTLLETNQKFVEAYMVGLNHEMARELLWREFPTDQRGTPLRQFWDPSAFFPGDPPPRDVRERLRDIPPLHVWPRRSDLGTHDQRGAAGDAPQLVLAVRGELLKRYPTAVVYAQKADWARGTGGAPDGNVDRVLAPLTAAEELSLPRAKMRTPLFEARIDPDIFFLGFDLTVAEARGAAAPPGDAGWFFVLKERPGEARFGLDEPPDVRPGEPPARLLTWKDLTWGHVATGRGANLGLAREVRLVPFDRALDESDRRDAADAQARLGPSTNAAELAYILYQAPALVAVHASRMV